MPSTLRLLHQGGIIAGQTGDVTLEITNGSKPIQTGGGFLVYPPITTVPHVWSMVRWQIGGCCLTQTQNAELDAWMVLPDRFIYAESCAVMIRVVNTGAPLPPGFRFQLILSDCRAQTFAMPNSWFALETDANASGHQAYTAPIEGVPIDVNYSQRDCRFDYEKYRDNFCYFNVIPGTAARLSAVLEAKPRPDGTAYLGIRAEDAFGNNTALPDDHLELTAQQPGLTVKDKIPCSPTAPLKLWLDDAVKVNKPGTYNLRVYSPRTNLTCLSSYTSTELPAPIYFGDLHGHTELSDGLGQGQAFFDHARDISFIDFVSLTDHNRFDDVIIDLTEKNNQPGRFITLFGRERNTAHEHRNVYSTNPDIVAACEDNDLWKSADQFGQDMMFAPHHTNAATKHHWFAANYDEYDCEHERFIEVVQNRGSFEREEIGGPVFDGGYGASVQAALNKGCRFGFVGGSDTHRGNPGGPSHPLGPYFYRWRPFNGITGAAMTELTRPALWQSLWNRTTYCTTGTRILLDFQVNNQPMGSEIPSADKVNIKAFIAGTNTIQSVEIIRDGQVCHCLSPNNEQVLTVSYTDDQVGAYYYLRVRQVDEHEAYSSPVWIGPLRYEPPKK